MTQVANLLLLAPDIQESLLHLALTLAGSDASSERRLRPLLRSPEWLRQRIAFSKLKRELESSGSPSGRVASSGGLFELAPQSALPRTCRRVVGTGLLSDC